MTFLTVAWYGVAFGVLSNALASDPVLCILHPICLHGREMLSRASHQESDLLNGNSRCAAISHLWYLVFLCDGDTYGSLCNSTSITDSWAGFNSHRSIRHALHQLLVAIFGFEVVGIVARLEWLDSTSRHALFEGLVDSRLIQWKTSLCRFAS